MSAVYLDWNATTPPHPAVLEAMRDAQATAWGNPASSHAAGRRARAHVDDAREAIAALAGFHPRDVVLTSGGTEANNLALLHPFSDGAGALVTSRVEHPSVVRVAEELARRGVLVEWAEPDPAGLVSADAVAAAIDRVAGRQPVRLVSLQAVNHETGVVQPVAAVAARARSAGARLHVDAVQALGKLPPETWSSADLISVAAHKFRGPKGVGALAARPGLPLVPLLVGGAQERGLRPGTQDAVACAGAAVAARRAMSSHLSFPGLARLRDRLEEAVVALALRAGVEVVRNGGDPRGPHVTNLSFMGLRGDELCAALDLEGVLCSSGSACSAGTSEPSPVVRAMLGQERAASAVRISLGEDTTDDDVERALAAFARVLARRVGA